MKQLLYIFLLGIFFSSCEEKVTYSRGGDAGLFYWNQTKCADPWHTGEGNTNEETIAALNTYLQQAGIIVLVIDFDNNSPLNTLCEACNCGTGQRLLVQVTAGYRDTMESLLFYQ